MIFKHTAQWILDKSPYTDLPKTQTRRPCGLYEILCGGAVLIPDDYNITMRTKWRVGQTYAIQPGRGIPAVGRIRILGIRESKPIDISPEDATGEGFVSPEHFCAVWSEIYSTHWLKHPCWVLTFELVQQPVQGAGEEE